MLIDALCDYYDVLEAAGELLPQGYSSVNIHYKVALTKDGEMARIINCQKEVPIEGSKSGKKRKVPMECALPKRTEKSAIDFNIIEHRPLYLFGLNLTDGKLMPDDRTHKAQLSHEGCVRTNLEFLEGLDTPLICAFRLFLQNWKPELETENEWLCGLGKDYGKSGYAFCLEEEPGHLLHEELPIKERWEMRMQSAEATKDGLVSQCSISGKQEPIARIHGKIKGLAGGLATGGVLVGYNNPSECSYGNDQAYNSGISNRMMEKYTNTLNYLLRKQENMVVLDGMTLVFWAMSTQPEYESIVRNCIWDPPDEMDAKETADLLRLMGERARKGKADARDFLLQKDIAPDVVFYMVGLKPNSSRISVKFFEKRRFADILENLARFQEDLHISKEWRPVSLSRIHRELRSPKSTNDNVSPALSTKLFEAALYGKAFPTALLQTMVRRVRTDTDFHINRVRAGVIKACINRNYQEEAIQVSLDKTYREEAYLCGRLFAVLEQLQQAASGNKLNRTIRDGYFASASARPLLAFPKLVRLAQTHLKKIKDSEPDTYNRYEKLMEEIMDGMEHGFPNSLSLKGQGEFIIGYYQQSSRLRWQQEQKAKEE